MTTRNKRKLAALNKENSDEHLRSNLEQTSNVPRPQEDYITHVFEEIEGRVTKKLSQEFSSTENCILGAFAHLDGFLMNPLIQGHSGTTPGLSWSALSTNQGTNEDDSQSGPHPEAGIFHNQRTQNSGPEDRHDMVTGVLRERESLCGQDMATGATEQIHNRQDMVTGDHEEVTYCSPSTFSGKQKKNHSTSQTQCRSENTPATVGADPILLTPQKLANNNNSANFHNNINRLFKLPKSLTTTMPRFDRKSEKFELFEDLFQTSLKIRSQLTEEDTINYFHSLMKRDALQTFKNIISPTRKNLGEILAVFRTNNIKPLSMATAKHKFQKFVFNPANQKLVDFVNKLQRLAKDAFGIAAHAIVEQFIYAKMRPHLKRSINQAHFENGTYEQIVTHLEKELELNGFEAPDKLHINTVSHNSANTNTDRPKPTYHHCKKPGNYRNQCGLLKRQKEQSEDTQNFPGKKNSGANTSVPSNNTNKNINNNNNNHRNSNRAKRNPKTVYPPCETCGKTNYSTEKCYYGANAPNRPPPGKEDRKDRIRSKKQPTKMTRMKLPRLKTKL